jgi:hypothetical protein
MADYYAITDGIALVEDELETRFVWKGSSYPCAPGERTADKLLGMGGLAPISSLQLVVRASILPTTQPAENDTLIFDGKTLRVNIITHSPDKGFIVLDCVDVDEGV